MSPVLPDFLPGTLVIAPGTFADYRSLERFHYRAKPPRTWAAIWVVRFESHPLVSSSPNLPVNTNPGRRCALPRRGATGNTFPLPTSPLPTSSTTVAVGVLSWPVPLVKARNDHFGLSGATMREKIAFANAHIRTITRVIVHPRFRSLGLASLLVRHACRECPTRYVEALAAMGRACPLFERAGMRRFEPSAPDKPVYYLFDRENERT